MEQDVRFCELDGRRIAYAGVGEGPLLLFGGRWVSHLEDEWDDPDAARRSSRTSPRTHRVVRYDRLGAGLSDRALDRPPTPEIEAAQLAAVLDACSDGAATLFACSCAGLATARFATRSRRIGCTRSSSSAATRRATTSPMRRGARSSTSSRVNWLLAAQMLAGLFVPRGGGEEIDALSRYQRHAADADVAAAFLELDLDVRCPAVPAGCRRRRRSSSTDAATARCRSAVGASLRRCCRTRGSSPLAGDSHLPWMDDQRDLQRALAGFLDDAAPVEANGDSPLSRRETEVLRLVAAGLSNREIASSLVLSEHTVHRHVANILGKLTQSSRAAAAAHATRAGYI